MATGKTAPRNHITNIWSPIYHFIIMCACGGAGWLGCVGAAWGRVGVGKSWASTFAIRREIVGQIVVIVVGEPATNAPMRTESKEDEI